MKVDYKKMVEEIESKDLPSGKKLHLGIVGDFTIKNIFYPLKSRLYDNGYIPSISFGGYNQYIQEFMDKSSWIHSTKPDVIYFATSSRTFFHDLEYTFVNLDSASIKKMIEEKVDHLKKALSCIDYPAKIILPILDVPTYSPYGLRDAVLEEGMRSTIEYFNKKIISYAQENPAVVLLDFEKVCSTVGKSNMFDEKMFYIGKILLTNLGVNLVAEKLVEIVNASYGNIKKVLVVDLDNTLWRGVIGEDGVHGIEVGETTIGEIYSEVQKILLNYKKNGVLLGIVSKNNLQDVLPVFGRKGMVVKEEDFISKKINWSPKSLNIKEMSKELNLGVDSFVFLDDNPAERLEVKSRLPSVTVLDFPEDVSLVPKLLKEMPYFSALTLTEEDKKRHEMYLQEQARNRLKEESPVEEYLHQLETKIIVKKNDISSLERITQLINKTNQFNLRTQRYTEEQVLSLMQSENSFITSVHVKDRFGDLGLTGVIILKKEKNEWFVDSFLLSCRVLARKIEQQFFIEALKYLNERNPMLVCEYIPTPKNEQVKTIYDSFGFELNSEIGGIRRYQKYLNGLNLKKIDWIKVENG